MNIAKADIESIDRETLSSLNEYTFPQILSRQAERLGPDRTAIREKAYGIWLTYSWPDYLRYTKHTGLGLVSLGLKRGENVGLILDNHPEWLFSELGAQTFGAVTTTLFTSAVAKELVHGLNRIQAAYVIVQDQEQVDKLLEAQDELSHVRRLIFIDPTGMRTYEGNPWLISFSQMLEMGEKLDKDQPDLFIKELWEGKPDDVALMLMTSGTTGEPKLVMLAHENFTDMAQKCLKPLPSGLETTGFPLPQPHGSWIRCGGWVSPCQVVWS